MITETIKRRWTYLKPRNFYRK